MNVEIIMDLIFKRYLSQIFPGVNSMCNDCRQYVASTVDKINYIKYLLFIK
jgi:hypothetical protein